MSNYFVKLVMVASLISATAPLSAQSNSAQDTIDALGNLFGALAQAGAKSKALKQWQAQDAQVIQCINTIFSSKNITADSFVAAGVGPNDPSVAPVINLCKVVMTTPPNTNFPCNVVDSKGQQVATTCNESFAVEANGSLSAISRDDYLRAIGRGQNGQVANFETTEANAARLTEEARQRRAEREAEYQRAVAERKRFEASPAGKRQAALEAQRARMEARVLSPAQARQVLGVWQSSEWVSGWGRSANVIKIQSYKNGLVVKSATAYQSSGSGDFEFQLDNGYTLNYGESNSDYAVSKKMGRLKIVVVTNMGTAIFYD